MEIIPIEYCEVSESFVHLNQSIEACAFEHKCGDSEFSSCPLREFFYGGEKRKKKAIKKGADDDMPSFYFLG